MNQIKLTKSHTLWAIVTLILSAILIAVLVLPNGAWAQLNNNRVGYDSLSADEQATILEAIQKSPDLADTSRSATTEFLWTERHQEEKPIYEAGDWTRRADSYLYDYSSDTLIVALINAETGEIDSVERVQNVQPPLNANEVRRALEIAWADPEIQQGLKEQHQLSADAPLENVDQLQSKAFIFRADAMPDDVNEKSALCGLHRCAQLLLYTQDQIAFEFLPIIDLSKGIVAQSVVFVDADAIHSTPTDTPTDGGQPDEH